MRLEPRRDTTCIMLWPSWRVKVCSSAALFRFFLPPFMDPLPSQVPFLCNSATMGVRPSLQTILSHLLRLVFCLPCANSERSAIQNFDCFHFSFNSQQTNKQFNIKKNRDQVKFWAQNQPHTIEFSTTLISRKNKTPEKLAVNIDKKWSSKQKSNKKIHIGRTN